MKAIHIFKRRLLQVSALSLLSLCAHTSAAQSRYDTSKLQLEKLNRGVVAVRQSADSVAVSWRYLPSDPENLSFDVYRDGKKVTKTPLTAATFYMDANKSTKPAVYEVRPSKGKSAPCGSWTLPADAPVGYIDIKLDRPEFGLDPMGNEYHYAANDASIGDVDGDGQYEIFLKWDPSNAHDNAHNGFTGPTYIDCIRLDGTKLWRINLGENIRSGAHYIPFLVGDYDGDGKAELIVKTADGTIDGTNRLIGDPKADFRNLKGRIIAGPEYLTVFNGLTGEAMSTIPFQPARGELIDWGDSYANRSERYLAANAYLDGSHLSAVMTRGYYAKTALAAYDWDGTQLRLRWLFDSTVPGNEKYGGQGNHNLRVADVDGDGCDEIIYGQMTVDNDGTGLYSTGMDHGDAIHLLARPSDDRLYVWSCHENRRDGTSLRDAATGEVILQYPSHDDVGRCMAADIDPGYPGVELWSPSSGGIRAFDGTQITQPVRYKRDYTGRIPVNMALWWDGDLLRELLDRNVVSKFNPETKKCEPLQKFEGAVSNNGSKAVPCLQGDIIGDWREEVLLRSEDNNSLRLYVTTIPTGYRFHTFLTDPAYRHSIANQNVGYNQPTDPGFYFGPDLKGRKFRGTLIK